MKAVMLSIQPKWIELIASGKKTVEVRRTKPKLETPFKCYIYETKGKLRWCNKCQNTDCERPYPNCACWEGQGKVIGEFVCDKIFTLRYCCGSYHCEGLTRLENDRIASASQLSLYDMRNYLSCNGGYAWHITDLVIYDNPKELSEFYVEGDCDCMNCRNCAWFDRGNGYNVEDDCNLAYKGADEHKSYKPIKRPPQSWCYCEELKGEI